MGVIIAPIFRTTVQFPHRYEWKQDIEISGQATATASFGNRKQRYWKCWLLHRLEGVTITLSCWEEHSLGDRLFYRTLYVDFYLISGVMPPILLLMSGGCLCMYAGNPMKGYAFWVSKRAQETEHFCAGWYIKVRKWFCIETDCGTDCALDTHVCCGHGAGTTETQKHFQIVPAGLLKLLAEFFRRPVPGDFAGLAESWGCSGVTTVNFLVSVCKKSLVYLAPATEEPLYSQNVGRMTVAESTRSAGMIKAAFLGGRPCH